MRKRLFLLLLILLNLVSLFFFSHQDAKTSTAVSNAVSRQIEIRMPDYEQKNQGEKNILHANMQSYLRKFAHAFLFFTLGIFLLLYADTFFSKWYLPALLTVGAGLVFALGDEFHQTFIPGRTAQWSDVAFDMLGIVLGIGFTLSGEFVSAIYRKIKKP